jgi:hypothetical protein
LKQKYESTRDHQLNAVRDVATLADVVENLNADVQRFKASVENAQTSVQNVSILASVVDSLRSDLNRFILSHRGDKGPGLEPATNPVSDDSFLSRKLTEIENVLVQLQSKDEDMTRDLLSAKEMIRCHIHNTNRPNKLDCYITQLETLTSDKHSNLLGRFLSCTHNEVL